MSGRCSRFAVGIAALLTLTGCASSVPGTASRAGGGPAGGGAPAPSSGPSASAPAEDAPEVPACDALSTQDVADAYQVDGAVQSREGPPKENQGVRIETCQYIHQNIIVAALQVGHAPNVDSPDKFLSDIKDGLASSGADTTVAEPVSGLGDRAEFLPKIGNGKQPTMIAIRQDGDRYLVTSLAIAQRPGLPTRQALRTLTKAALGAM